jgi:hypothetical protein
MLLLLDVYGLKCATDYILYWPITKATQVQSDNIKQKEEQNIGKREEKSRSYAASMPLPCHAVPLRV